MLTGPTRGVGNFANCENARMVHAQKKCESARMTQNEPNCAVRGYSRWATVGCRCKVPNAPLSRENCPSAENNSRLSHFRKEFSEPKIFPNCENAPAPENWAVRQRRDGQALHHSRQAPDKLLVLCGPRKPGLHLSDLAVSGEQS